MACPVSGHFISIPTHPVSSVLSSLNLQSMSKFYYVKNLSFTLAAICAIAVVSCYKIRSIDMPHTIAAGEEFTVKAAIVSTNGEQGVDNNYILFGIRLPEDWDISVPENVFEHYTAEGVLDGTWKGVPNEVLTDMFNYRYPVEGYKWIAYSTGVDGDPKNAFRFAGDTDYIQVNIKVKSGNTPGDYKLDFIFGDEGENFSKYADDFAHDPNRDNRLCQTGTFAADPESENQIKDNGETNASIKNVVDVDTSVKVTENGSVDNISADAFEILGGYDGIRVVANSADVMDAIVTVYNTDGMQLDMKALSQGETTLRAQKGINIVEVLKGDSRTVRKVFVK